MDWRPWKGSFLHSSVHLLHWNYSGLWIKAFLPLDVHHFWTGLFVPCPPLCICVATFLARCPYNTTTSSPCSIWPWRWGSMFLCNICIHTYKTTDVITQQIQSEHSPLRKPCISQHVGKCLNWINHTQVHFQHEEEMSCTQC
jgi:hypothetical protein